MSVMGLFVIIGAVILAGTLIVGGAVALFKLVRRPAKPTEVAPPPPPRPGGGNRER